MNGLSISFGMYRALTTGYDFFALFFCVFIVLSEKYHFTDFCSCFLFIYHLHYVTLVESLCDFQKSSQQVSNLSLIGCSRAVAYSAWEEICIGNSLWGDGAAAYWIARASEASSGPRCTTSAASRISRWVSLCYALWCIALPYIKAPFSSSIWFAGFAFCVWHCWLSLRKSIQPVKNWLMSCWRGYLTLAGTHF